MFGVEYLENPWRKKIDFFSKTSSGSIFWRAEKGGRSSNSLGVTKSFVTHVVRVPK